MRQSQQKNRMRGRGRKGPNPMSRTYESNGPDVKIRGTAAHVAEKYASLARDAIATGDNVMAENYLQHAEHYNRIIAAAAAQQAARNEENAGYGRGPQPDLNNQDNDDDDDADDRANQARPQRQQAPQQVSESSSDDTDDQPQPAEASEQRPRGDSRRSRRPRRDQDNGAKQDRGEKQAQGDNGQESSGEPASANGANGSHGAANGNGSGKSKRDISSDASMLPDSILGAAPAAREAGAEE